MTEDTRRAEHSSSDADGAGNRARALLDPILATLGAVVPWLAPPWLVWARTRVRAPLLLTILAGLLCAVTLVSVIPLYSNAAAERLLHQQLQARAQNGRLAVAYRFTSQKDGPLDAPRHEALDQRLLANSGTWLGVDRATLISSAESGSYTVRVWRNNRYEDIFGNVSQGYVGYRRGMFDHVKLVDGTLPKPDLNADGEVEALISAEAYDRLPVKVGSQLALLSSAVADPNTSALKVRIVGAYLPNDPNEPFWYGFPDTYQRRLGLFVDDAAFHNHVMPTELPFGSTLTWYQIFDEKDVRSSTADRIVDGIEFTANQVNLSFSPAQVDRAIYAAFEGYRRQGGQLRLLLLVFATPVIAIILYYMSMATRLLIESQRSEIALLRSRGARDGQIVSLVTADALVLVLLALAVGPLLGVPLARLVGSAFGFLVFARQGALPVQFTPDALTYGLIGAGLALVSIVIAAATASRGGVVAHAQARGRALGQPWWQRYFVDMLLAAVTAYAYSRLVETGGLIPQASSTGEDRPFIEPLVLVVPVLFLATCGLVTARLLPGVVTVLSWVASLSLSLPVTHALRQLARAPGHHRGLILLLVWTVGLGTFSAAIARTLDTRAVDQISYAVGADVRMTEQGWFDANLGTSVFPPIEEYLKTPGIRAASRVASGKLRQQMVAPGSLVRILAIDRTTFAQVAWYRPAFAGGTSLGELMNRLAANPTGVLVERRFAEAAQLGLGSPLVLSTETGNEPHQFLVVGLVDYFPTLYPSDGPFVVGNIDYVEDELGFLPHDVWLSVEPTVPLARLQGDLQDRGLLAPQAQDARLLVQRAKQDPLRVGTFGLLSVGFIAGTLLTVLGFIVHTLLIFRERALELGLLRAMGFTVRDLGLMLTVEHLFAVAAGLAVGSFAGLTASRLFGPYLLVAETGAHAGVPPVMPVSPTADLVGLWLLLAGLLFLTIPALVAMLARRRLAEGLRLGETTG